MSDVANGYNPSRYRAIGTTVKRYISLLATYVVIAILVVALYAPWGLALRPWDYSILRAGASIICAIALLGTFGVSTWLALKDPDVKLLEPAEILDDDQVLDVLAEYEDQPYVGPVAREATEQIRRAEHLRERLLTAIGHQFSEGSLSWDRFSGMVERARTQVLRNSAYVANDVQSFDRAGYARELQLSRGKSHKETQSLSLFERSLADMREVLDANEQILFEMATLEHEVKHLQADDTREGADATLEELKTLIEDTRFYK